MLKALLCERLEKRRSLPIALAHCMVVCKPERHAERLEMLNRLYRGLSAAEQINCRAELARCRKAKAGRQLAEVTGYVG